jgi:outer membrane protein
MMVFSRALALLMTTVGVLALLGTPALAENEKSVDDVRVEATNSIKSMMPEEKAGDENSLFFRALLSAYEENPTLKAARFQLQSVFESLPQAESGWRPTVAATGEVSGVHSNADPGDVSTSNTSKDGAIAVVQPLYTGGQTVAATAAAKNTIKAQIASLESSEQQVLLATVTSYMNLLRDETLLRLSETNQTVIRRQKDATDQKFKVGELTRTDVSQAEARLAAADAEVITAGANLSSSRAAFEKVVGFLPDAALAFPATRIDLPKSREEALVLAEKWNPDIRSSRHLFHAAQDGVRSTYGQLLPDVSLQAGVNKSYDPQPGTYEESDGASVGLVATIPLYEAGLIRSKVRQAKQTANQRYEQVAETGRSAREQVISSWESLKAAEAEISARKAQVEAAEVARFGVHQEADLGSRTVLDTLDADQEVRDAQAALITARRNEVVARYTLAAALGLLTPKNLGFAEKVPDYERAIAAVRRNILGTDVDSLR